jgi:hypothetical protein
MEPNNKFLKKPKSFWACVRSLSQQIGYTSKGKAIIPSYEMMAQAFQNLSLNPEAIILEQKPTSLAVELFDYFSYRAKILEEQIKPNLMNAEEAKVLFEETRDKLESLRSFPMNKQKGDKKAPAYLTALVNMMIENNIQGNKCDYDPRKLTTLTKNGSPIRTFARRVDGAFPSSINPIAIWEIKEYYYTTTFGSRVADGVYETLLDGMEIEELLEHERIDIKHYLMIDAYYTWWECGKSYLCRIVDMLHMGYVDEVLFGREVVKELPRIVKEWCQIVSKNI